MELEKAILKLKAICKQCHNSKECWNNEFCSDCYIEVEDVLAIETVLRAYEELRKENEEIKKILSYEIEYRQKLEEDLYQSCSNYVVPKDKIKELIEQLEKEGYWNFLEERELGITKNILKDLLKEE